MPRARLTFHFGEDDAQWLFDLARGVDREVVKPRALPKSAGCGKTFRGANKLCTMDSVLHWLKQLGVPMVLWRCLSHVICRTALELQERLEADRSENQRRPTLLTVHFSLEGKKGNTTQLSRSTALRTCEVR